MKAIIGLAFVVMCGSGDTRPVADQIQELRDQVAALEERVAALEVDAEGSETPQAANGPVLQLLEIKEMPIDLGKLARAADLDKEIATLEKKATDADREYADLSDSKYVGDDANDVPRRATNARKTHLRKLAADLRDQAKAKRAEATKLRRDSSAVRQRVIGWNGERQIILETTRDLSGVLTQLAPRSFISWNGKRVGLNDEIERFEVSTIKTAQRPAGFVDAP